MSLESWLWLALIVATAYYILVGRAVVGRHRWELPMILIGRPNAVLIIALSAPVAFIATVMMGFLFTEQGWRYLIAALFAFFVFAVQPKIDR